MMNRHLWECDMSRTPPSFLPSGINTSNFVEVTVVGDVWAKFLDTQSGELHDGKVYRAMYEESLRS
jgi:hypothetical protein